MSIVRKIQPAPEKPSRVFSCRKLIDRKLIAFATPAARADAIRTFGFDMSGKSPSYVHRRKN
jgi:hypothetical protein